MSDLSFRVTFHGDDRTRYRDSTEHIRAGLETLACTFARCYSTGSVPAVRVEILPEAAPTATGPFSGGGADASSLPATDPAVSGSKFIGLTRDEANGFAWWNGMDRVQRLEVLRQANALDNSDRSIARSWELWKAKRISMEAKPS